MQKAPFAIIEQMGVSARDPATAEEGTANWSSVEIRSRDKEALVLQREILTAVVDHTTRCRLRSNIGVMGRISGRTFIGEANRQKQRF
jgi:hypothetical protein